MVDVNYLAVFLAGASSMLVGSVWYAPSVFGKTWAKLAHVNLNKKVEGQSMAVMLGTVFVLSLITAFVLAYVAGLSNQVFGGSFLMSALTAAFWAWLGFTATRMYTHDLFEGRRKKLTLLNSVHELITFLVMGLVIGIVGL